MQSSFILMHTLYDSETYSVTHMLPDEDLAKALSSAEHAPEVLSMGRHGFEIVDKRSGKEVYLDGSWAELFQAHISAWENNTPSQEEVEETLGQFAELAHTPVWVH
jgi:hypothetical protein